MLVTGQGVVEWVARQTNEYGNFGAAVGIGWKKNDLIAGVVFNDYNGPNINIHCAGIGRKWLTKDFLWAVFDYPFRQVKAKRITGLVGEGNKDSRRFIEHVGFHLETRLKNAHPTGDLLVYVMFKEECRWILPEFVRRSALAQSILS